MFHIFEMFSICICTKRVIYLHTHIFSNIDSMCMLMDQTKSTMQATVTELVEKIIKIEIKSPEGSITINHGLLR